MIDMGFWELLLILIVALLVIGPERLPRLALTIGQWLRRLRQFFSQAKNALDQELRLEELKKNIERAASAEDIEKSHNNKDHPRDGSNT